MMRRFQFRSLQGRFIAVAVVAILPLLVFAFAVVVRLQQEEGLTLQRRLLETARALAIAIDREIDVTLTVAKVISGSPELRRGDLPSFYQLADNARRIHGRMQSIYLTDAAGQELLSLLRPFGSPLPRQDSDPDFRAVAGTRQPSISNLRVGPVSRRHVVRVLVPVQDAETLRYVVGATLPAEAFMALLGEQRLEGHSVATILDRDGVVIARSLDPLRWLGHRSSPALRSQVSEREGVYESTALEGTPIYGAYARAPVSGFVATVALPVATATAAARQSMFWLALGGAAIAAGGLALAVIVSRRAAAPVAELASAVTALGRGQRVPALRTTAVRELAGVQEALDRAATGLEERRHEYERRVAAEHARNEAEAVARVKDEFVAQIRVANQVARMGFFDWDLVRGTSVWSPEMAALYGLDPEVGEMTYRRWRACVHPEDVAATENAIQRSFSTGEYDQDFRVVWPDGTVRTLHGRARVSYDGGGQAVRMIGVNLDITDRKAQETRLALLARASEALASSLDQDAALRRVASLCVPAMAAACTIDLLTADGGLRRVAVAHGDPSAAAVLGAPGVCVRPGPEHPLARVIAGGESFVCGEATEVVRQAWSPATDAPADRPWMRGLLIVPLRLRERVLGAMTLFVGHGRPYRETDVAFFEDLARRMAQAVESTRLHGEVEAANRAKDEFLAMLGHELRNPIAAIANAAAVLERRASPDPMAAGARAVVRRQVDHLARLMDDLLDVGRLVAGKIRLSLCPVDLAQAVTRAVETLRATGMTSRHRLRVVTTPAWVDGDPVRLDQIVTNLVTNALKYTPAGGEIVVTAGPAGDQAVLVVADTGMGIPQEMRSRIFELFVQGGRSTGASEGGLGIGLTLVRQLVELHGGLVRADSEGPGHGAQFTVTLPLRATTIAPSVPEAAPSREARHRVLVIEDHQDNREMLATLLQLAGHEVHLAPDGATGVEQALALKPDIALVDIGLPDIDGYDVAERVRRTLGTGIRLVALTGYGQAEDRARSAAAGFDAHLVKPVDPGTLAAVLAPALRAV